MPRPLQVSAGIRFVTVPRPDGSESHARLKFKEKISPSPDRQSCTSTFCRGKETLLTFSQAGEIATAGANSLHSKLNQVFYEMTRKSIILPLEAAERLSWVRAGCLSRILSLCSFLLLNIFTNLMKYDFITLCPIGSKTFLSVTE